MKSDALKRKTLSGRSPLLRLRALDDEFQCLLRQLLINIIGRLDIIFWSNFISSPGQANQLTTPNCAASRTQSPLAKHDREHGNERGDT